jgi:hypothetical protein
MSMQHALLALAALTLAGCSVPEQKADAVPYSEPAVVTGSHVPRKNSPAGVESIEGDAIRAQGQILPSRGVSGQKGQQ